MFRPYSFWRAQLTRDRIVALLVTLTPLVYFLPAVCGQLVISPDDGIIQNIPLRVAVANVIRAGHLPLWNPYIFCGMPLHAAAQGGVLFPLNWFYVVFNVAQATNLMMLSTYLVAALGAFLYARRAGASIAGAALTSLVWQWSGFLVGQIGHTNIVQTAALLPWLLWAIDGYGASGKRSRGLLIAVITALALFAGHQQTFTYLLLVAVPYALVMSRASTGPRASYVWSLAFIAAGLALAAVQILPTLELLRNSLRADASYDFFTSFSMPRRFILTFLAPYLMGGGDGQLFRAPYVGPTFYAEYNGYVGLVTIALALLVIVLKRDARIIFWIVVAGGGLFLALGRFAPLGFYHLIYHVPVLNLFRVPARHLMEVEFALAVLAGRGLTALSDAGIEKAKILRWVAIVSTGVLALTWLAVTIGRPANFRMGREAPVTLLRAPELFLPVTFAAATGIALWYFARCRRGATMILFAVLSADLVLWGQSSGWRIGSPKSDFELWGEPATVHFLRSREAGSKAAGPYRIFTQDNFFDPGVPVSNAAPGGAWVPSLQPDIYMMHGIENAAGYEGFGLARYSRLAGDMKVWGEFTDPERTLRGESREIDLLNVRYLLARSSAPAIDGPAPQSAAYPMATQTYGGQPFGEEDVDGSGMVAGDRIAFKVPPVEIDHLVLLTTLAWSADVPDGEIIADLHLTGTNGQTFDFQLRAGEHTAEWAYDRPDIRSRIKHQRAPLGSSYEVKDAQLTFQGHTYVSSFALPQKAIIQSGEITVTPVAVAPRLILNVSHITLANGARAFPLRKKWMQRLPGANREPLPSGEGNTPTISRWKRLAKIGNVSVFENARALPRVWLAPGELVATGGEALSIIRTGKTLDGSPWNPLETALVESSTDLRLRKGNTGEQKSLATVTRHGPNQLEVKTESAVPGILVLSENHYPGWRAYVDGRMVKMLRVNYNQRGVALLAGEHVVTFAYWPLSILAGFAISGITLLSLLLWTNSSRDRVSTATT
jgi:Bacterial membrane protein YfhO